MNDAKCHYTHAIKHCHTLNISHFKGKSSHLCPMLWERYQSKWCLTNKVWGCADKLVARKPWKTGENGRRARQQQKQQPLSRPTARICNYTVDPSVINHSWGKIGHYWLDTAAAATAAAYRHSIPLSPWALPFKHTVSQPNNQALQTCIQIHYISLSKKKKKKKHSQIWIEYKRRNTVKISIVSYSDLEIACCSVTTSVIKIWMSTLAKCVIDSCLGVFWQVP